MKNNSTNRPNVISISPFDCVEPALDFQAELKSFINPAGRDERFSICGFPVYLHRMVEVAGGALRPRKTVEAVIAFSLREGLPLLEQLEGVKEIRACRDKVQATGCDDIAWFESFTFEIPTRNSARKREWSRVCLEDASRCRQLASGLGLPSATVAILAIMLILIHAPMLPGDVKRDMFGVLVSFARMVKERAVRAQELADRAVSTPRLPAVSYTFQDLLDAVKQGDE